MYKAAYTFDSSLESTLKLSLKTNDIIPPTLVCVKSSSGYIITNGAGSKLSGDLTSINSCCSLTTFFFGG